MWNEFGLLTGGIIAYEDGKECSETSAFKTQTPGNYPKVIIQHSKHGESLKSSFKLLNFHKIYWANEISFSNSSYKNYCGDQLNISSTVRDASSVKTVTDLTCLLSPKIHAFMLCYILHNVVLSGTSLLGFIRGSFSRLASKN